MTTIKADPTLTRMLNNFRADDRKVDGAEAQALTREAMKDGKLTAAEQQVLMRAANRFEMSSFTPAARKEMLSTVARDAQQKRDKADIGQLETAKGDHLSDDGVLSAKEKQALVNLANKGGTSATEQRWLEKNGIVKPADGEALKARLAAAAKDGAISGSEMRSLLKGAGKDGLSAAEREVLRGFVKDQRLTLEAQGEVYKALAPPRPKVELRLW